MNDKASANKSDSGNDDSVFDIERLKELIELMRVNELSEIDLRHSDQRIRLRSDKNAPATIMAPAAPASYAAPAPVAQPAAQQPASAPAEESANIAYVKSPMVGTFYSKPNPNADAFVKVGDHVDATTTVCTVEAMKMFNEIPAGISGKIVAVLVQNEEPVDVNKPLFKIDTSQ